MKLNLGCGRDVKEGYTNVDFRDLSGVQKVDLSVFPWPWPNESVEEVMMLDFLEHFPYRDTSKILGQAWRVLTPKGKLVVQVPDFDTCSDAIRFEVGMFCNRCGWEFTAAHFMGNERNSCRDCGQNIYSIAAAAVGRLYGGQDYPGNFHYSTFTSNTLQRKLQESGFDFIEAIEKNENGESFRQNWNMKFVCKKDMIPWGDD